MNKIAFGFILIMSFVSSLAFAKEAKTIPVCSLYYAKTVKAKLLKSDNDKYKHCAVSCMLANRCGSLDAFSIGALKEVWDLFTPGDADIKDLKADLIGVNFSWHKIAVNDKECNQRCIEYDWSSLKSE